MQSRDQHPASRTNQRRSPLEDPVGHAQVREDRIKTGGTVELVAQVAAQQAALLQIGERELDMLQLLRGGTGPGCIEGLRVPVDTDDPAGQARHSQGRPSLARAEVGDGVTALHGSGEKAAKRSGESTVLHTEGGHGVGYFSAFEGPRDPRRRACELCAWHRVCSAGVDQDVIPVQLHATTGERPSQRRGRLSRLDPIGHSYLFVRGAAQETL